MRGSQLPRWRSRSSCCSRVATRSGTTISRTSIRCTRRRRRSTASCASRPARRTCAISPSRAAPIAKQRSRRASAWRPRWSRRLRKARSPATTTPPVICRAKRRNAQRREALPDADTLQRNLRRALVDLPFRDDVFAPFLADVERTRSGELLSREDLEGTALALKVDSLLLRHDGTLGRAGAADRRGRPGRGARSARRSDAARPQRRRPTSSSPAIAPSRCARR